MCTAIVLGSKPASVVALRLLIRRGWDVRAVVAARTQQEWLPGPALTEVAKACGIPVVHRQDDLPNEPVDLVISYMFRHRVKPRTLSLARFPLNFHAAPLPEFGGWAFYNAAILEAVREYGCTCHIMDTGFDTGPIVRVRRFPILPDQETAVSLERRAQLEMLRLFEEVLETMETQGQLESTPQDPSRMRYLDASQFAALKAIPPDAVPEEADRIARAFWYPPYEMAYVQTRGGARAEVIPRIVKDDLAAHIHSHDLRDLLDAFSLRHDALAP